MRRIIACLMLAAVPAAAQTGGPPTTIITPGTQSRSIGAAAPTPPVNQPNASPPQTGQLPSGRPDTAQRPTPDQSR